ncbi:ATP-binding protein, partial [Desulfobacula sp.]|uniref:ATP-binding protein n=1 Tax=Desulfobacula sp. TaxID=2593537 RepID=UPI00271525C1
MKIKTITQIGILLCIVVTVTLGLFIFITTQKINQNNNETILAAKIVKDIAELKIVMHEYLLYSEERSLIQWRSKYNLLSQSFIQEKNKFDSQNQKILFSKIHQNLLRIGIIFGELSEELEKEPINDRQKDIYFLKLKKRLASELLVRSQAMISLVFQLQHTIQTEVMLSNQITISLIIAFFILFAFFVIGILFWINNSVAKPITALEKGVRIIGSGNLNHKISTDAKNEIGQLSRAFDKMSMDLKRTTTSIGELNKEIVERKKAEKDLQDSKEKLEQAVQGTSIPTFIIDSNHIITHWNNACEKLTGFPETEMVGTKKHWLPFYPEERQVLADLILDGATEKEIDEHYEVKINKSTLIEGAYEGESFFPDLGEKVKWLFFSAAPLRYQDGTIIGAIEIIQDITERKQFESHLQQAQKMEAIGTLAGGIAHDFNNILFPILGYADLLLADIPEDSPFRDGLNQIHTSALRAKDLVRQILTFARQDSTEVILMKMQLVVKEALRLIRSTIPTTIDIIQDIRADCGTIKADPTQIHQIVMNLATNAYHAMEETGGELKVSLKEVELGEQDVITPDMTPGDYACLTIADTGTGMDKDVTEKIFDPFFTTKGIGKGTGMGLSVVHGIVKNMNGAVKVYSEPGKGTEFHVYFPVEKSSFEKQNIQTKEPVQGGTEQILLVDD